MEIKEVNVNIPKKAVVVNKYSKETGGVVYFLGFIGSFIYFVQIAETFGAGFVGFLKALVWPVYLVYHLFKFLGI